MKESEEEGKCEDVDDEESHSLSQLEIEELITTKFVTSSDSAQEFPKAPNALEEVDKLEKARAVGSPLQISPIECPGGDDFTLEEYESFVCPKKKKKMEEDHAVILLNRIMNASDEMLRDTDFWETFERSKKWNKTSRVTELALIDALILLVDERPTLLHVFCHHLTDSDIFDVIEKSITTVKKGPEKYRSLFRLTVPTEMTFRDFADGIENEFADSKWTCLISHPFVASSINHFTGIQLKMMTEDIMGYVELEDKKIGKSTLVTFELTIKEKPHVKVNLEYCSELLKTGRLERTIVIAQWLDSDAVPPTRRVTFGDPIVESTVDFDVDHIPVALPAKAFDLIDYLESI